MTFIGAKIWPKLSKWHWSQSVGQSDIHDFQNGLKTKKSRECKTFWKTEDRLIHHLHPHLLICSSISNDCPLPVTYRYNMLSIILSIFNVFSSYLFPLLISRFFSLPPENKTYRRVKNIMIVELPQWSTNYKIVLQIPLWLSHRHQNSVKSSSRSGKPLVVVPDDSWKVDFLCFPSEDLEAFLSYSFRTVDTEGQTCMTESQWKWDDAGAERTTQTSGQQLHCRRYPKPSGGRQPTWLLLHFHLFMDISYQ